MKRLVLLLVLAFLPAPPAALADGCPLPCSGQSSSPPGSKLLYTQPRGPGGELVVYDTATRQAVFALPPGIASADGRAYYSAFVYRTRTFVKRFTVGDARIVGDWVVPGRWALQGVSPTGRWAALRGGGRRSTKILVLDGRGNPVHRLSLRGNFEVETISRDGKRLFLIEHLGARRYNVRQFDLSRETLVVNPLRAQGVKIMAGYAWSGVGSPDGRWLLTLYLSTPDRLAFVHSLDLERSSPACIQLPSARGFSKLTQYSLTLAPDGTTLYAANPALGVVAVLDLEQSRVRRVARFRPIAAGRAGRAATLSTISRNGRTMYFSSGRDLWAYDTAYGVVRGPYRTGGRVVGVGYGAGDRQVYAVRRDGRMLAYDAASGKRVS